MFRRHVFNIKLISGDIYYGGTRESGAFYCIQFPPIISTLFHHLAHDLYPYIYDFCPRTRQLVDNIFPYCVNYSRVVILRRFYGEWG